MIRSCTVITLSAAAQLRTSLECSGTTSFQLEGELGSFTSVLNILHSISSCQNCRQYVQCPRTTPHSNTGAPQALQCTIQYKHAYMQSCKCGCREDEKIVRENCHCCHPGVPPRPPPAPPHRTPLLVTPLAPGVLQQAKPAAIKQAKPRVPYSDLNTSVTSKPGINTGNLQECCPSETGTTTPVWQKPPKSCRAEVSMWCQSADLYKGAL